ncbi:MAG: LysE family translocator [Pseudomonadota bacterium]
MSAYICAMTMELFIALISFATVSSFTPGPNNLMLMASGTNFGFARTIPHSLGVIVGYTAMVLLVGIGLSGVFTAVPALHDVMKAFCVAYLLYLAWKIATAPPPGEGPIRAKPMTFTQAALFQWINPKGWTMALTAASAYAVSDDFWSYAIIALVFGLIGVPSNGLWMVMGVQARRLLSNPRALRAFNIGAALLLVGSLYPLVFSH